jgi:viroplasmin and RNaseH domain-containing protein
MLPASKKSYVVYNGRKNGMYTNWVDCYAQAYGYQDCVVRLYKNVKPGMRTKKQIEEAITSSCGYYNDILSNIVKHNSK